MSRKCNPRSASHTPGKWRLYAFDGESEYVHQDENGSYYKIVDEQECTIADIPINPLDGEWPQGNARLIAAAPDLLDTALVFCEDINAATEKCVKESWPELHKTYTKMQKMMDYVT